MRLIIINESTKRAKSRDARSINENTKQVQTIYYTFSGILKYIYIYICSTYYESLKNRIKRCDECFTNDNKIKRVGRERNV